MSFHWDFFRRQAAAEMRFAAAVENTYLFPEWQNPLLMNYTRNGDYKTLEDEPYILLGCCHPFLMDSL
jgi:hypothetical protein